MISERTSDALQHMKAQGVRLGHAPYGYEHINQLDDKGRRLLVPLASEQQVIVRMAEAHTAGVGFNDIARQLNAEGIRARRGGDWCGHRSPEGPCILGRLTPEPAEFWHWQANGVDASDGHKLGLDGPADDVIERDAHPRAAWDHRVRRRLMPRLPPLR